MSNILCLIFSHRHQKVCKIRLWGRRVGTDLGKTKCDPVSRLVWIYRDLGITKSESGRREKGEEVLNLFLLSSAVGQHSPTEGTQKHR